MADTINVPGLGPTKAVYVWVGGALVVGIVGYAWYKNSQAVANADYLGADPDDYAVGDYDSPLGSTGGNSTGSYDSTDPDAIDTNAKWTDFAVQKLTSWGYDAPAVSAALGKYLNRQGLTEDEIRFVQTAIAAAGPPPVGGPYPITNALPQTPGTGDDPLHYPVTEGTHLTPWLASVNAAHPGLNLTKEKLIALNPGLNVQKANDFGYISPTNPENRPGGGQVIWVINSHTDRDVRIR